MAEEMRWLEYTQRLRTGRRGACVQHTSRKQLAVQLFRYATDGGARALGVQAGRIESGYLADFFTLRLDSDLLRGWTVTSLLGSFVFGCSAREVVARTCVHGQWSESYC
jgi:formimidoylglutamate deiminase